MSGQRVIVLAGAPQSNNLSWAEEDLTELPLTCFLHNEVVASGTSLISTFPRPVWRVLHMEREYVHPVTVAHGPHWGHEEAPVASYDPDETFFLTMSDKSFISTTSDEPGPDAPSLLEQTDEETLSQFYEYSYAVHEDIPSSQIIPSQEPTETCFSNDTDYSTLSSFDASASASRTEKSLQVVPVSGRLSNLSDIPNAAYLRSISPQTMTVNLVVGVISMPQPRSIKTRRDGRFIELVEMLVGDETKAGFVINVWLPSVAPAEGRALSTDDMRSMIKGLRPQDVVLVRNVALDSFRGKVYGQSLRKNTTKLDLLFRNAVDREDDVGAYSAEELNGADETEAQAAKAKRVREWVMKFVGAGGRAIPMQASRTATVHRKLHLEHGQLLPPDTQ